jgi:uncharacterized membrane protein
MEAFCASLQDVLASGPPPHMTAPNDRSSQRAHVLDVLRLFAIFQMVQGHTVDAVLDPVHRTGLIHALWQSARGLTSVAFLFLAGVSFAFATRTERGRGAVARARRMRRAALLIAIGYAMRAPFVALLFGDESAQSLALQQALIVDVLQCIGVTLIALEVLTHALPDTRARSLAAGCLGAALIALGPITAQLDASGPLRPLLAYVTSTEGSLFPLVPWAGHALLGAALGPLFFERADEAAAERAQRSRRLMLLGAPLAAFGAWLAEAVDPALGQVARLGAVLLVAAALVPLEQAFARWPSWLLSLAQHSLLIYVLHVLLAYGEGVGLASLVGRTLGPGAAFFAAAAMLLASALAALAYDAMQRRGSLAARAASG